MLTSSDERLRREGDVQPANAPAVVARGLGKTFRLGQLLSLRRTVDVLTFRGSRLSTIDAVDDVSFEANPGECLAVLGVNGSGKTTLLQMIAGITVPSRGEMEVRGTVLPLFEIAQAFHIELTGRENVVLFGTVLGLSRRQIDDAMDEVAAFAEVERHIDTPMKRYSMGMRARLSFATALRFPADIYIFDEVLAVVDDRFRARCHDEMRALVEAGRTVLFVSHNMQSVRYLADRGMWLHDGAVEMVGPIAEVAGAYEARLRAEAHQPLDGYREKMARAQIHQPEI